METSCTRAIPGFFMRLLLIGLLAVLSTGSAQAFIICLAELIQRLAVERLHIIGATKVRHHQRQLA